MLKSKSFVCDRFLVILRCLGGDGLITEVVNSNLKHAKLSLMIVPVGTDNALCESTGICSVYMAALVAVKVDSVMTIVRCY